MKTRNDCLNCGEPTELFEFCSNFCENQYNKLQRLNKLSEKVEVLTKKYDDLISSF